MNQDKLIKHDRDDCAHSQDLFQNLRFVLIETSHPGNIGAAARAIKTMGFGRLYLVNPRFDDALTHPEAIAFASGAQDVLEAAIVCTSVSDALVGCNLVAAVSARLREFSPPIVSPREFGAKFVAPDCSSAAVIFGNERYGLPNEIVLDSQFLINIPANPEYSSLNLAQAIQVLAYESRMAIVESQQVNLGATNVGFRGEIASVEQVEGMFAHLERALIDIGFLDASSPKKLMPRLKRLFARTQLEVEEVNIIRGISKKIIDKCAK